VLLSDSIKEALKHNNQKFYEYLNKENTDLDSKIDKDIDRTFLVKIDKSSKDVRKSNFLDFKEKKKNLFNVLKAYGNMDPEVAYCQGFIYLNKTPKLIRLIESFKISVKNDIKDLDEHFEKLDVISFLFSLDIITVIASLIFFYFYFLLVQKLFNFSFLIFNFSFCFLLFLRFCLLVLMRSDK